MQLKVVVAQRGEGISGAFAFEIGGDLGKLGLGYPGAALGKMMAELDQGVQEGHRLT